MAIRTSAVMLLAVLAVAWLASAVAFPPPPPSRNSLVPSASPLPNCTTYSSQAGCDGIEPMPNAVLPPCGSFLSATADTANDTPTRNKTAAFVLLGDYGLGTGNCQPKVSALVHELERQFAVGGRLDFLFTVGDNAYWDGDCSSLEQNVGTYYSDYFTPNTSCVNPSADPAVRQRIRDALAAERDGLAARGGRLDATQRLFPSIGNHDWDTYGNAYPSELPFAQYFSYLSALAPPDSLGQFYSYAPVPDVQLFALNSNLGDPTAPGWEAALFSDMVAWLRTALAQSTARYKFVYFHHPPYCTAQHDPLAAWMRLPFGEWGASAVFSGHEHVYERILPPADSPVPYIVQGLSGHPWLYDIHNCAVQPGSQVRYNSFHGALLGILSTPLAGADSADGADGPADSGVTLDMCFYSLEEGGTVVDHFVM